MRTLAVLLFTTGVAGLLPFLHLLLLHKKIRVFAHGSNVPAYAKDYLLFTSEEFVRNV